MQEDRVQKDDETRTKSHGSNGQWVSKESYSEIVNRGSDLLSRANTGANQFVRQYPVQALVGGLIVGLFVGAAFGRRRK